MSEATFAVSACLDGLRATRVPAELAMISRPHDAAAAWQIRALHRPSAEVNGTDDLFVFANAAPPRADLLLDTLPTENAGRGDLASRTLSRAAPAPAPATLALLVPALAALRLFGRRRA